MVELTYKNRLSYQREAFWDCDKCGHEIEFAHSTPLKCPICNAKCPNVHLLIPDINQDNRVRYHMEGVL